MRIKTILESKENINLYLDYRRYFISFIKKVFKSTNLFKEIYNEKTYKPFVFSTYFENNFKIENSNKTINASNRVSFLFSSGDPVIITNFYNGLITLKNTLKNQFLSIGNLSLQIKSVKLLNYKKINSNKVIFRTLGICVFTNPEANKKEFQNFYILPSDNIEKFNEILLKTTNDKYNFLMNNSNFYRIKLNLIQKDGEESIKEVLVKHYDGYIRGFRGTFELQGDKEILQFVYDYGLGVRTGQGFGLLEIVKELNP
jgi:CRISPR-associated endoribonuclease Cas6